MNIIYLITFELERIRANGLEVGDAGRITHIHTLIPGREDNIFNNDQLKNSLIFLSTELPVY